MRRQFIVLRHTLIAAVAVAVLASCGKPAPKFNGIDISSVRYGKDFSLTDPDGKTRTLADFRGKVVLLFFGFTQCPDICPTALARAVEVRKKLEADGDKMQAIFVTIDPERDTPELMRAYTQSFDPSFLGLRADLEHTKAIADEFRIFYQKVPTGGSYTMDHTAITYVFDPSGKLRLAMRHDVSADQFASDIRVLLHS